MNNLSTKPQNKLEKALVASPPVCVVSRSSRLGPRSKPRRLWQNAKLWSAECGFKYAFQLCLPITLIKPATTNKGVPPNLKSLSIDQSLWKKLSVFLDYMQEYLDRLKAIRMQNYQERRNLQQQVAAGGKAVKVRRFLKYQSVVWKTKALKAVDTIFNYSK